MKYCSTMFLGSMLFVFAATGFSDMVVKGGSNRKVTKQANNYVETPTLGRYVGGAKITFLDTEVYTTSKWAPELVGIKISEGSVGQKVTLDIWGEQFETTNAWSADKGVSFSIYKENYTIIVQGKFGGKGKTFSGTYYEMNQSGLIQGTVKLVRVDD